MKENPQKNDPPEKSGGESSHDRKPREVKLSRSAISTGVIIAVVCVVIVAIYLVVRHIQSEHQLEESSKSAAQNLVEYVPAKRDGKSHDLSLPGDIQANTMATLYARTNGYIKAWYKDIGATVKQGEVIAEIEAPDLDAQLRQASSNLAQARANLEIARITFEREKDLLLKKVVSQQEFDQSRTGMDAQDAAVKSGEANLQNLQAQENFKKITAPFDGIVTRRFIDIGTLVSQGGGTTGTMLFSVAQSDPLRIFVYVPQVNATDIHEGMTAKIVVEGYAGRDFEGVVARTAGAIDPTSRTLLTEVDIPNHDGALYAGMYGQVKFVLNEKAPPILIPANAFMFRADGPQVAVVREDSTIHWQQVKVGRDFGTTLELISGLEENAHVVINPTDDLREGMKVEAKQQEQKAADKPPQAAKPTDDKSNGDKPPGAKPADK